MVVLTVLTCSQGYTKLCSPEELHPTTRERECGLNGTGLRLLSKDREATKTWGVKLVCRQLREYVGLCGTEFHQNPTPPRTALNDREATQTMGT